MSTGPGKAALFQREVSTAEVIANLRHALDIQYRRFCQAARADWKRLLGTDPADECVTVRVTTMQPAKIRGSGFLKSRRKQMSKSSGKNSVPRFAH